MVDVKSLPAVVTYDSSPEVEQLLDQVFGAEVKFMAGQGRCKQHKMQHVLWAEAGKVSGAMSHAAPTQGALSFGHRLKVANQVTLEACLEVRMLSQSWHRLGKRCCEPVTCLSGSVLRPCVDGHEAVEVPSHIKAAQLQV
eukprot:jgi/Chrzof1/7484/Cz02g25190.t1